MSYFVLTPFFPNSNSFRGSYLLDQVKAIKDLTNFPIKVIILSPFHLPSKPHYSIEGIDCITFKVIDLPSFLFPGIFNRLNQYRFKKFIKDNNILINTNSIIHAHINYPSISFLKNIKTMFNAKTILQHHGLDILQFDTGINLPILKKTQNKLILKQFLSSKEYIDCHIVVSQKVKNELLGIDDSLIHKAIVCINGVDTSKFYLKNQHNTSPYYNIGCVANFWDLKDQITLLRAIKRLQRNGIDNIRVSFVGKGPTLKKCQQYAIKNGLHCEFIEEKKHTELVEFYNFIDLFVLPSYYEAFGCVYLESLACGTPFIAVRGQGIEDIIDENHKNIQLIDKKNDVQLSEHIMYFYKNNFKIPFDKKWDIKTVVSNLLNEIINSSNE